jgi:hypothetical protein
VIEDSSDKWVAGYAGTSRHFGDNAKDMRRAWDICGQSLQQDMKGSCRGMHFTCESENVVAVRTFLGLVIVDLEKLIEHWTSRLSQVPNR